MDNEKIIRLGAFLIVFLVLMVAEVIACRRQFTTPRRSRWQTNLILVVLNPLAAMVVFSVLPAGIGCLAPI